jgi:acyl CoA:acetate/3-ketoacid CoA transferase beta subunit
MNAARRAEVCAVAIAELFRGSGALLASPMGLLPSLGARLARASFAPDLLLTDGAAALLADPIGVPSGATEAWLPYRAVFDLVWSGRRHVVMGAAQLDRFGNQNIALIGDPRRPTAQLLGPRGAPGNTLNHATSYFVARHSPRVFVEKVDVVTGVGNDRARALGHVARFHDLRAVVTNLCVLDFRTPDGSLRLASLHPGVTPDQVAGSTGFELAVPATVAVTRPPSDAERRLLDRLDPDGVARREVAE